MNLFGSELVAGPVGASAAFVLLELEPKEVVGCTFEAQRLGRGFKAQCGCAPGLHVDYRPPGQRNAALLQLGRVATPDCEAHLHDARVHQHHLHGLWQSVAEMPELQHVDTSRAWERKLQYRHGVVRAPVPIWRPLRIERHEVRLRSVGTERGVRTAAFAVDQQNAPRLLRKRPDESARRRLFHGCGRTPRGRPIDVRAVDVPPVAAAVPALRRLRLPNDVPVVVPTTGGGYVPRHRGRRRPRFTP
mmetsp:Transcript_55461/g.154574  ORF Transcript_55461/g.154574 Transcript_55461/m.154574 type:complete len:246 (-) Transcript_55461:273-1010(-)